MQSRQKQVVLSRMGQMIFLVLGFCLFSHVWAEGKDLLAGTDTFLTETLSHSGKKYIFMAEGLLSLAAFIRTKNVLVLFGIVVVAVFFNVIMNMTSLIL